MPGHQCFEEGQTCARFNVFSSFNIPVDVADELVPSRRPVLSNLFLLQLENIRLQESVFAELDAIIIQCPGRSTV